MPTETETEPKSKGGRPRLAEPTSPVTTWVPPSTHDRLIKIARARDASVSAVVRELLHLRLPPK